MARIRTIKPEFWQDERLASIPRDYRLLFIGLWNVADDDGRLRGNPLFIRAQVFPYDTDIDVQDGLEVLERIGRITRYYSHGESYIWIRKFREHQRIDKPKASNLPSPEDKDSIPGCVVDESGTNPGRVVEASRQERKGMEGKGREGTGGVEGIERERETEPASPAGQGRSDPGPTPDDLQALWNQVTNSPLPKVAELGKTRRRAAQAALERRPLEGSMGWRAVFERIARSSFCRGESGEWVADFDWAIRAEGKKPEPALKILEGSFDRTPGARKFGERAHGADTDWSNVEPAEEDEFGNVKLLRTK